jgi:IclR family KDG regulon transcriptional repressor
VSKENSKNPEEYNVRAVERALKILNCFNDEHTERGISEISQAVGLHKATAHRIVTTLLNYNFLERAEDGQKYRLGLALAELGLKVIRQADLRREALPFMNELNRDFDESCDLSIYDQGQVFYIEVISSSHALNIAAEVGQRLPAYCTASGKVFLAYLSEEELNDYLETPLKPLTKSTITSSEELRQQLLEIRKQGYALDNEETEIGIRAIAAPIFNQNGSVIGSISIPSPRSRRSIKELLNMAEPLIEAARAISQRIGFIA